MHASSRRAVGQSPPVVAPWRRPLSDRQNRRDLLKGSALVGLGGAAAGPPAGRATGPGASLENVVKRPGGDAGSEGPDIRPSGPRYRRAGVQGSQQ